MTDDPVAGAPPPGADRPSGRSRAAERSADAPRRSEAGRGPGGPRRSGAPRRSDRTRAAILAAARGRFGEDGYERATIRAIAAQAAIDPSMVMRYYGSKEQLFAAAIEFDLRLPDLTGVPREQVGRTIAEHFFTLWEGLASDDAFVVLLRSAVTNEIAAERARDVFRDQVAPAVAAVLGEDSWERSTLVACQVLGVALGRYLLRLPGAVAMSREQLVDGLAPCLQAALTGPREADPAAPR